ncbi:hypothetical protein ACJX0J_016764, partial [Zea mays]
VTNVISSRSSVSFQSHRMTSVSIRSRPSSLRFKICCSAKKETVDKVCSIVKEQLALPDGTAITGESKFAELGADSLDTIFVWIVTATSHTVIVVRFANTRLN